MRLLYTANDMDFFHQNRVPLVQKAIQEGHEVHVAGPPASNGHAGIDGLTHHPIPLSRRGMQPWREAWTVRSLVRLYRDIRPDLVHHMTIKPVIYGATAARIAKTPAVVNTITGLGYAFLSQGVRGRLLRSGVQAGYRLAFRHPNQRVVFQNPDDMRRFLTSGLVREEDALLIRGSGVDLDRFTPTPMQRGKDPLVVLPSRLLWDKGVREFVEAARTLKEGGTRGRFALVGDTDPGNPAAIPRSKLQGWADQGIIEWWGWRHDMQEVYKQAHVVCLPSYREGVPRSLLEAAATARPVVTTDAPGCREAVIDGETGLRVPVKDPQALAQALRVLLEDAPLRKRMGRAGRELVEREFDERDVIEEILAVYGTLSAGRD